ncbi:MAG TPA: hypothetical protein VEZ55_14710 [Chitinophagaceae bacterium]|nr:hypothetical protein [Chitinophagaceae bacterium]
MLIIISLAGKQSFGQVNEPANTPVYDYLYRMAQKGLIEWTDYQLPLDRTAITSALTELADSAADLSKTELAELKFHLQEYSFDSKPPGEGHVLFKRDSSNRFRAAMYEKGGVKIFLDPITGIQRFMSSGKKNTQYFSGVRVAGYFGKGWGFNFFSKMLRKKVTLSIETGRSLLLRGLFLPYQTSGS